MKWRTAKPPTLAAGTSFRTAMGLALALCVVLPDASPCRAADVGGAGPTAARPGLRTLPRIGLLKLFPESFLIPDAYYNDPGRDPSHLSDPVDSDLLAAFSLFSDRSRGLNLRAEFRSESTRIQSGGDLLRLRFEWRF